MPNPDIKTPLRTGSIWSFIRWILGGAVLLWSLAALTLVAWEGGSTRRPPSCRSSGGCRPGFTRIRFASTTSSGAGPDFARPPARGDRRRGRPLLPAPRLRLARDPDRGRRRFGRGRVRGASTITQQLVKTCSSGPAAPFSARARRPHWFRWPIGAGQTPHSRDLSQRGRMGARHLRGRSRVAVSLRNRPEGRPAAGPDWPPFCQLR